MDDIISSRFADHSRSVNHGYAVGLQYHFHGDLVHAVGRCKDIASGIWYAYCLQEAFKDAVLDI